MGANTKDGTGLTRSMAKVPILGLMVDSIKVSGKMGGSMARVSMYRQTVRQGRDYGRKENVYSG